MTPTYGDDYVATANDDDLDGGDDDVDDRDGDQCSASTGRLRKREHQPLAQDLPWPHATKRLQTLRTVWLSSSERAGDPWSSLLMSRQVYADCRRPASPLSCCFIQDPLGRLLTNLDAFLAVFCFVGAI